jgi:hypothetical protein
MPIENIEEFFSEEDIAALTKRSIASIRRDRVLQRGCPFVRIGRSVRYRGDDLRKWLEGLPRVGSISETRCSQRTSVPARGSATRPRVGRESEIAGD